MQNIKIYDIESYHNFFCIGIKDYETKQTIFLEITEEKNNIKEMYEYFFQFDGFLVSVNGIHYDNIVVKSLLKNYNFLKNKDYLTEKPKAKPLPTSRKILDLNDDIINLEKTIKIKRAAEIENRKAGSTAKKVIKEAIKKDLKDDSITDNAFGLEVYECVNNDGKFEWNEWYSDETGEDISEIIDNES